MHSVVFADIDGTLIEPVRRLTAISPGVVAATDRVGRPVAYRTPQTDQLLRVLNAADLLIPVTGRSRSAFERVDIPFNSFAIMHHGAMITDGAGQECSTYAAEVRDDIHRSHQVLDDAFGHAECDIAARGLPLRVYRQMLQDRTVEVCIKHADHRAAALDDGADAIAAYWRTLPEVRIHRNGNNLALLPDTVTKERAVRWVQDRLRVELGMMTTFGIGDSTSDMGFMAVCDYWMIPGRSQIAHHIESIFRAT